MNRRWRGKDYVSLFLQLLVVVLLLLTMYMVDRQWLRLDAMRRLVDEQTEDIKQIQARLSDLSLQPASNLNQPLNGTLSTLPPSLEVIPQGDWMIRPLEAGIKTLSPLVSTDKYASDVQTYVIETLLVRDPDSLDWNGLLAESWSHSENGLIYDFKLKPNLKFSDGKALTAHDVKFSHAFVMNEQIAAPALRSYLDKIASVSVIDSQNVRFILKEPYFASLSLLGEMPILAQHYYSQFLDNPEIYNQSKGELFGSGPYKLADAGVWSPESGRIELIRNEDYWGNSKAPLDKLVWSIVENESARLTTFRNKELDLYNAKPREFTNLTEDAFFQSNTQPFEFMPPFQGYSYIGWNGRKSGSNSLFADPRVRKAMSYLTDVDRIINLIKLGYAERTVSPFNRHSKQHNSDLTPIEYNPALAKKLLADAGYMDRDQDDVLESADGIPFEFELVFFQGREETRRMVLLLKDLYAQAGILLKPKAADWPVMIDMLKNRTFDAITLGWTSGVETDIFQMFHSSQIEGNGDNFVGFENKTLDALIEQARSTTDEEKRMKLWQEAERILYAEQPYTFLYRSQQLQFYDKRFRNLRVTKMGVTSELVPFNIFVPTGQQRYSN